MKQIELTQNKVTLVDDDIFDYLNQWKWQAHFDGNNWYATGASLIKDSPERKRHTIFLHHFVVSITRLPRVLGLETDHIDGNGLNNQRTNLRIVLSRQNNQNRQIHRNGRLVGTTFNKDNFRINPWMARIVVNGKTKQLGYFSTEQEAHEAYLKAIEKTLDK